MPPARKAMRPAQGVAAQTCRGALIDEHGEAIGLSRSDRATDGRETRATAAGWLKAKGELVSMLQALVHAGELRIAANLPDFRVRFSESSNATSNAREGAHGDLVFALGAKH